MSSYTNLSNWQNLKLSEICVTKKGLLSSKTASIFLDGNIPFIKAKDIHFDTIYNSHKKLSYEIVEKLGIEIVPRKSILITVSGPTAGSIAILGTDAVVENNIYYSIANFNIIDPEYLFYYLCFKKNQIIKSSRYLDRVSIGLLSKLDVPIPSIKLQKVIVEELKKLLDSADELIGKIKKEIVELNNQRENVLQEAFSSIAFCENEIELCIEKKEFVQIKECGLVQAGKTPSGSIKKYFGKEFPFFNTSALEQGMNIQSSKAHLSARGLQEARSFKENSVLVCTQGQHFGKAGICRTTGACNTQMISITPHEIVIPEYLYFQLISAPFQEQMKSASKKLSISKVQFEDLYVKLPGLEKQRKVANDLMDFFLLLITKSFN